MYTYAQNCEDLILSLLLPQENGFYVDVGANDPDGDSVTKLFYQKGWCGINIEPIPTLHESLSAKRPRDVNINAGIASKKGTLKLRHYNGDHHGLSTFSQALMNSDNNSRQSLNFTEYTVMVKTLKDVFKEHCVGTIDFLKVDVEGFEQEVLTSNNWNKWRPQIVVVENTKPEEWVGFLEGLGYGQVFYDGLNRYFASSDYKQPPGLILRSLNQLIATQVKLQSALEAKNTQEMPVNSAKAKAECNLLSRIRQRLGQNTDMLDSRALFNFSGCLGRPLVLVKVLT